MLEKQRQQLILDFLEEAQFASVRALCDQLNSSEATIRRDLNKLAASGKIKKIRGGAEVIQSKVVPTAKISGKSFWVDK